MSTAPPPPAWPDREQNAPAAAAPLSGFWLRFAAYVVDWLIIVAAIFAMVVVFMLAMFVLYGSVEDHDEEPVVVAMVVVLGLAVVVSSWLYEALLTSSPRGATLGKMAAGIRIVRADGTQLS